MYTLSPVSSAWRLEALDQLGEVGAGQAGKDQAEGAVPALGERAAEVAGPVAVLLDDLSTRLRSLRVDLAGAARDAGDSG